MPLFQNILIPTDFSHAAWQAVQYGLQLVESPGSRITLLHVFPNSVKYDQQERHLAADDLIVIGGIKKQIEEFCADLENNSEVKIKSVILDGAVDKEILRFVGKYCFDLIIMGVNSNGTDNLPGTHLNQIIEKSNTPVLVIPNKLVKEKAVA